MVQRASHPHHGAPKPGISAPDKHVLAMRHRPPTVLALCIHQKICGRTCELHTHPPRCVTDLPSVRVDGVSGSGDLRAAAAAHLRPTKTPVRIAIADVSSQAASTCHRHRLTHFGKPPSQWLPRNARHLPGRMVFIVEDRMSSTSSENSYRTLVCTSGEKAVPRAALGLFPARSTSRPVLTHASPLRSGTTACGVS